MLYFHGLTVGRLKISSSLHAQILNTREHHHQCYTSKTCLFCATNFITIEKKQWMTTRKEIMNFLFNSRQTHAATPSTVPMAGTWATLPWHAVD